ncbi:hypothetical protein SAMN05216456_1319 [Devosia crocina]|uniref:Uncharacterized protein n=1 Tax=Devosia crocina TaxID=429728 RepID=A0A1I7N9P7_9HYPH|nr:hypothetical protein [Devosia crocina]SFV31368.1 hypothetical protein SAMN05216456_1319 [Devosia crocina]
MAVLLRNNATSLLAADITAGATALTINADQAGLFPTPANGDWFPLTLLDAAGNMEIVRATARAGATITVVRAQEGTTAKSFGAGSRVDLRMTSAVFSAAVADAVTDAVASAVGSKAEVNLSNVSQADARTKVGSGTMAYRNVTISTSDPTAGANGDFWAKVI